MKAVTKEERSVAYPLVLIFAILALGIVVGGTLYYRNYAQHFRAEAESQLSTIAKLKVDELVEFRKERLGDAATFFNNTSFSGLVRRFLEHPEDADAQQQVQEWAAKYMATDQYDLVRLIDAQGVIRMSVPAGRPPLSSVVAQRVSEVLRSGQVALEDFHRNEHDQRIYLTLLVPILDRSDHSQALGVLALRINPEAYLYPFLSRWPTPSQTSETLLVRRDGNDVLFLNELKFQTNAALNLRISIENTNAPAVKAILGEKGIVEGTDYRGAPVLAALYAIPDSPWFLVARMDTAEVYAPLSERLWTIILLVSALLLCAGAGASAIWRHQRVQFYKERSKVAEAMRASEVRYRRLFEAARDGILILDAETGMVVDVNPFLIEMLGFSHEVFLGKKVWELGFFKNIIANQANFAELQQKECIRYEDMPLETSNGRQIAVEFVSNVYLVNQHKVIQCNIRDITARKQASEALHHEQTLMATLMKTLPDPVYFKDAASRFLRVNPALARRFGLGDPAQAVGKTDADFFTEEHASKALADEQEIIRTGQPLVNIEEKETWPDGSETWVLTTKLPLRDDAGRIIGTCGISSDITERKRAEEAMRLSEERLLKVIKQTRCIMHSGQVEGPEGWRERALNPESPFHWDFPVLNEEAAQKILPLEQAAGERYQETWFRSRNRDDDAQMNWISGNAFLNDLPFYRNVFRCTDKNGVGHWMQEFVTVRKLAENRWEVFGISTDVSDLKRVEAELRESQALYHSLVDQMPAGVFRKDAKGRYVFVNSTFCRLKEMSPDQFLGKTVLEVESKDVALATKDASHHATIVQSGNSIEDDEVHSTADGETRYYHVVKSPVFDSAGKIAGTQGVLFDITELKQATLRIADALNFNQTVLRASPVGIVAFKASGSCVSANETIGQIIGGTREEVLKQNFRQLESWKHSGMLAAAEAALAAQTERNLETQLVTTFGRKAWFSCRFAPFHYEGEPHLLIVINDITERKRAEEALRWSETQLHVILESTADGILAVDSKGKVIETNRRFVEFGRIPQSLIDAGDDRALLDFVRKQLSDPDAFLERVQSLYGTDAVAMDTLVFKDGRIFERYSFPMMMDKAIIGRVWSFRDITVRKRQEKELSEKNTELERFTYTVSHDLKSPLVTVKTFLGYLEQDMAGPDKERVKQDLAYMHTAADKMGQLLDELLNLARVGRKMNPAERVTFKELAQEAVRLVAGRISTGGAEVQVADATVVLEGDRPRLMEIWQNLVENACKFMGNQPKPQVEVGVEQRGSETVFFVRDNGAGIDPRYQEKVFGLFEKLDPKGEGTGMGLALVRRIVEIYKGRIWVESPGLGQGATFLFTLPGAVVIDPEQSS